MRFSKKIIILNISAVILFVIAMFITYWKFQSVPEALIEPFIGFFGIEGGVLGVIKVTDTLSEKWGIFKEPKSTKKKGTKK